MLCQYILAFKAGEEALAAVSQGTRAELGECRRTRALVPMKKTVFFLLRGEGFDTPAAHPVKYIS